MRKLYWLVVILFMLVFCAPDVTFAKSAKRDRQNAAQVDSGKHNRKANGKKHRKHLKKGKKSKKSAKGKKGKKGKKSCKKHGKARKHSGRK